MARWRGGKASTRSGKKWSDFANRPEMDHCQLNKHLKIIGAKKLELPSHPGKLDQWRLASTALARLWVGYLVPGARQAKMCTAKFKHLQRQG